MHIKSTWLTAALFAVAMTAYADDKIAYLDQYDLNGFIQVWGTPHSNKNVSDGPLTIAGKVYKRGIGTHAEGMAKFTLDGKVKSFTATVGSDDATSPVQGSIQFKVVGDGKELYDSGLMRTGEPAKTFTVALNGVKHFDLCVLPWNDGNGYDHANWCDASFAYEGKNPVIQVLQPEKQYILTPKESAKPQLNNVAAYGSRPGHPFLYRIPCTGQKPVKITVEGLPEGLTFDAKNATISGMLGAAATTEVTITATNKLGKDTSTLKIVGGDKIALTPPMGWNSWNCFAHNVSDLKVRAAADAMVKSGLADYGYDYVNIDDFWENRPIEKKDKTLMGPQRDAQGFIITNERFPDMKKLYNYIHGLGLKGGIYSSPGPLTCGSCVASFDHEYLDTQKYAEWGVDYLKYDWCSYHPMQETSRTREIKWDETALPAAKEKFADKTDAIRPYALMGHALKNCGRDIVFSLCQYGGSEVWKWAPEVGGNAWRTTGDILDSWANMRDIWNRQADLHPYAAPGQWNDPDMLVVGPLGWGDVRPCRLTPSEQYTHFSAWAMLNSPLLLGCDLTQLDAFTRNILMNREIIAVNQDELGKQARRVKQEKDTYEVWQKEMKDGSQIIGIFSITDAYEPFYRDVTISWSDYGFDAQPKRVRDLWRQKDLKLKDAGTFTVDKLPRHGVMMLRVWK